MLEWFVCEQRQGEKITGSNRTKDRRGLQASLPAKRVV